MTGSEAQKLAMSVLKVMSSVLSGSVNAKVSIVIFNREGNYRHSPSRDWQHLDRAGRLLPGFFFNDGAGSRTSAPNALTFDEGGPKLKACAC